MQAGQILHFLSGAVQGVKAQACSSSSVFSLWVVGPITSVCGCAYLRAVQWRSCCPHLLSSCSCLNCHGCSITLIKAALSAKAIQFQKRHAMKKHEYTLMVLLCCRLCLIPYKICTSKHRMLSMWSLLVPDQTPVISQQHSSVIMEYNNESIRLHIKCY